MRLFLVISDPAFLERFTTMDTPRVPPTMAMIAGPMADELVGLDSGPETAAERTFQDGTKRSLSLPPTYRIVDSMLRQTEIDEV